MALKLYTGIMGSGKTYEVASVVILGALRSGRRVVSNIAGLNFDAYCEILEAEGIQLNEIGQLVPVEHEVVLKPEFWRTDKDEADNFQSFIQPGDVVVLDEIWRFWDGFSAKSTAGEKCPDRVMNFFRMHRHMIHAETGVACDIALITQDPADLSRRVRGVVEETYRMQKLTGIGLASRYRVDIFNRTRIVRKPLRSLQRSYEQKYFALYKSHSQATEGGAGPVEQNIDDRSNILKGWYFKVLLPACFLVFAGAVYVVLGYFNKGAGAASDKTAQAETKKDIASPDASAQKATPAAPVPPPVDSVWRAVGYWSDDSGLVVMLADGKKIRVLYDPPSVQLRSLAVSVSLPEGGFATSYTGRESLSSVRESSVPSPVPVPVLGPGLVQ